MQFPRLFCPTPVSPGSAVILDEVAAHHAVRVLRLRSGDGVTLFDGRGGEFPGRITAIVRASVTVETGAHALVERESPLRMTLVQALQAGDRMDVTIRKAVELGAAEIVPVATQRSVVRLDGARAAARVAHWRQIVVGACEQCGRNRLPGVATLVSLEDWLARPAAAATRILLSPEGRRPLGDLVVDDSVELLVGPEGGLAPEEAAAAVTAGYLPVRLGPRILRTETAGMAALAAIQARWGDFV